MRKIIKLICMIIISFFSATTGYAQVGINIESPDADTDLTLGSTNKEFLPNKVKLKAYNDPYPLLSNIKNGTIVYNTTTVASISEGFYFWQDDSWHFLRSSDYKR